MRATGENNRFQKRALLLAVAAYAFSAANASAVVLPWLDDPWKTEEKVAGFGARSKPVICPPLPDTKETLNIDQVVVAVICHNPDSKSAYLSLLASAASYGGNFADYLPTIDASLSRSRSAAISGSGKTNKISSNSGISAGMKLYDFGQRELSLESAELGLIAAGYSYDSTLQGFIATALSSYYALLVAQNALEISKESERFAKASLDAANLRYEIGLVPLADQLQAKNSYNQAELATRQSENSLMSAQAALALLMGLPADTAINVAEIDDSELIKDPFGEQAKSLMELAKAKRVDLESSRLGLKSAEIAHTKLKRGNLGSINVDTSAGFDDIDIANTRTQRSGSIGVSVIIPIFTGFSQTYAETASRKSLEASRENLIKTELGVEQDVWNSWNNYQTAKQSWDISWDQLASARLLKDVTLGRYQEGLGTMLDVLNAQTQYKSALQTQLQTRLNLLTSRINLVRAVGVLDLETMKPGVAVTKPADAPVEESTEVLAAPTVETQKEENPL
ncbi:MAG: TolC family protein [Alphaproteobacteria bacterium]